MLPIITKITPIFPTSIFIQWDITDATESGTYTVDVERSGSPEGPWDTLAHALTNAYNFLDDLTKNLPLEAAGVLTEGANLFSLQRSYYYRVKIIPPSGTANYVYSAATLMEAALDKNTKLLRRKLLYEEGIALRKLNGIELMILKKKHWGIRCTECFDELTKEVLQEDCTSCYKTGFEGGYFTPIKIWGRLSPQPIQTQISPTAVVEVNQPRLTLLDYPKLEVGDLVVDLRKNERYEVKIVSVTSLRSVTVHQVATVSLLSHDSIEYDLLVDPYTTPSVY